VGSSRSTPAGMIVRRSVLDVTRATKFSATESNQRWCLPFSRVLTAFAGLATERCVAAMHSGTILARLEAQSLTIFPRMHEETLT